jgi:hypothetical protein
MAEEQKKFEKKVQNKVETINFVDGRRQKTSDTWRPSAAIWTSHETKNCHQCSSLITRLFICRTLATSAGE